MSKCIIMCAGEFEPLQIEKEEDDFVIAADNGLSYLLELGILPDIVIGDYDSLSPEGQRTLRELEETQPERVVHLPVEKDDTDTMAAVREGLARGYDAFYLYAALGGRLDQRERKDIFCPRTACCLFFRMKQESFRRGSAEVFPCFPSETGAAA